MEPIKIIAMIDRSAGNEVVGEMWTETKIFQITDTLDDIYEWVKEMTGVKDNIRLNVKLSVAQE